MCYDNDNDTCTYVHICMYSTYIISISISMAVLPTSMYILHTVPFIYNVK